MLKVNPSGKKKTAYGAKYVPKQKTISNSNSILDITCTDSRHNGKCNICAFHEEVHALEDMDFCQIMKSCLFVCFFVLFFVFFFFFFFCF